LGASGSSSPTIGLTSGDEAYLFGRLVDATRLETGHIALADGQMNQPRIFDSTGKHVVTYGRKGQGPGGFLSIAAVVAQKGDALLVRDQLAVRYSTFTVSGGFQQCGGGRRKPLNELLIKEF
jgi:hypothetical protein